MPALGPQKSTFGAQKTIHQRNKSSPALSSMVHAGNLKAAAKRTAFGDVSNTVNVSRPSKDDLAIGAKVEYYVTEKPVLIGENKKATALLRPAQRPSTISGLKGLLNNVTNSNAQINKKSIVETQSTVQAQQPIQSVQPAVQPSNIRKVLTKRSTAIFKDQAVAPIEKPLPTLQDQLPSTASVAPIQRDLLTCKVPSESKIQDESQAKPKRTQSKYLVDYESREHAPESSSAPESFEEAAAIRSDGIYIDDNGEVQVYQYMDGSGFPEENVDASDDGVPLPPELKKTLADAQLDQLLHTHLNQSDLAPLHKHQLATVAEPEEYWDDEEEEGGYDEEGYVTARSYKSRGENTTSGATTVLFPKMNQKAKREIAAAKELIEGSRTKEEIDDETWDTTMVAEYGDEIFQYMRELEVGAVPSSHSVHC